MRLLEPLQGVKMASGHYLFHATCVVTMYLINHDTSKNFLVGVVPAKQIEREIKREVPSGSHGLLSEFESSQTQLMSIAVKKYHTYEEEHMKTEEREAFQ